MNPMRLGATVAGLVVSLTVVSSGAGAWKPIDGATVVALQAWVDAVKTHTPGRVDDPVRTVAAFSYETRVDLNAGMELFLRALLGRSYNTGKNKAAETVAAMGRAAGKSFLKQAAVLHSDVAAYANLFPVQSTGVAKVPHPQTETLQTSAALATPMTLQRGPIPPLLMADQLLLNRDGEVLGQVVSTWNWPFARSLLDLVSEGPVEKLAPAKPRPELAIDPFVSRWYHATTAYMFASGLYGEATPHLQHAAEVLPDDAWVTFRSRLLCGDPGAPDAPGAVVGARYRQPAHGSSLRTDVDDAGFDPSASHSSRAGRPMPRPSGCTAARWPSILRLSRRACDWRDCSICASATTKPPPN